MTPKPLSRLKQISAAVVFLCLLSSGAQAGALGKLTVLSAIGQPLNAEIELQSVSAQEKPSLEVRLASKQAFSQANVEFNPALLALQFAVEPRGAGQVVHITSANAFNEPAVDVVLELSSATTPRAVREYSFLLDAPRSAQVPAQVTSPAAAVQTPAQAKADAPVHPAVETASKGKSEAAPKSAKKSAKAKAAGKAGKTEYKVKTGDSLSEIANRMRPAGVSLDQMLVAMYRANPDAFTGENMSRMRAGSILGVPDASAATATARPEATSIVVAQAQDFSRYRNQLAGRVAAAPAKASGAAGQAAAGKISARVEERAAQTGEAKDRLQLSKAGVGDGASGGMNSEDRIAADKAAADAASRIKELEKNVGDLQKLLEIKNRNLAELNAQKEAATAAAAHSAATPAVAPPAADDTAAKPADAAVAAAVPAAAPAKPKPAAVLAPDFFDDWRDNPMLLPGGGALAVILIAWALYRARRRGDEKAVGAAAASGIAREPVVGDSAFADVAAASAYQKEPFVTPAQAESRSAVDKPAAPSAGAAADEADALKIDLGQLDKPAARTVAPASLDMSKLDFDLELEKNPPPPKAVDETGPGIDLAAGLAQQSEKQAEKKAEQPAPPAAAAPQVAAKAPELPPDVAALSLDLGAPAASPAAETTVETTAAAGQGGDEEDETSSFAKEVNTKLDLAAAYQEIGDKDGARELLDEVIKAGNRRQVGKAQEMLGQLA
ncbi:MAG: fimbrial protein FimV [Herbaspirillum sp.]|jgi:FimV-like protein|nr:fimbrial protein FimV [Herbaspirillum sp.]